MITHQNDVACAAGRTPLYVLAAVLTMILAAAIALTTAPVLSGTARASAGEAPLGAAHDGFASGTSQLPAGASVPRVQYTPGEVVVKYTAGTSAGTSARIASAAGASDPAAMGERTRLLKLAQGVSVQSALRRLRRRRDVAWAVPDYRAHIAGEWIPNDTGIPGKRAAPGDWTAAQWNFAGEFGVNAPEAWSNVAAAGPGTGVVVAVLDTGVAYATRGRFRRSPDFGRYAFVKGHDFIAHTPYAYDRNGHGTFVAGTIAEETNNGFGLTGLAYAAKIMPVRVLNGEGEGDATTIAKGVRFAVKHGARVINMSLEFSPAVTASDIPELMAALRYAHRKGVVVVAAAGNEGHSGIDYPAKAPHVIAVGATTENGCLTDYSNDGPGLTIVAPGGGADANLPGDPNCHPEGPAGRDIFQMTFTGSSPRVFGFPNGYEGTSMAAPHVTATVALIIAAHVLGRRPSVRRITARLRDTARPLGGPGDSYLYGPGLLDAAAATAPVEPGASG